MKIATISLLSAATILSFSSCNKDNSAEASNKNPDENQAQTSFKIAWSHYTGWEPIAYMQDSGILEKHAKKNGIEIEVVKFNKYEESINQYSNADIDCVTITNMDALSLPAAQGVDSTIILPTSFSNGNDAIISSGMTNITELKGNKVNLVEFSVSHYLLARALEQNNIDSKEVTVVNSGDDTMTSLFKASDKINLVTWNPHVNEIKKNPNAKVLYDSSQIPGEIIDSLLVKTKASPAFKKALTGAWFETMALMEEKDQKAMTIISESAGGTLEDYQAQLATTEMFYQKTKASEFLESEKIQKTMEFVRTFAFDQGLYGDDAENKDFIGIEFPDGTVMGDKNNIKLRFSTEFIK